MRKEEIERERERERSGERREKDFHRDLSRRVPTTVSIMRAHHFHRPTQVRQKLFSNSLFCGQSPPDFPPEVRVIPNGSLHKTNAAAGHFGANQLKIPYDEDCTGSRKTTIFLFSLSFRKLRYIINRLKFTMSVLNFCYFIPII